MKPDVKNYLDAFQFLQEVYLFRKKLNKDFSYSVWSGELGIKNKAYLRLMVLGKRKIGEKIQTALSENLELADLDAKYFYLLLAYSQCQTKTEKNLFGKKMMELIKSDASQEEVEAYYDFLANPLLPKLHTLLSFSDIEKTPANLSRLLMASEAKITEGLRKLEELGMVEKNGDTFICKAKSFKVKDSFKNKGLEIFYSGLFEEAKAAIQLPVEERRFRSLLFAMKPEELQDFVAKLDQFAQEQLRQHDFSALEERRLFQVHFNFFPVTARLD
jgi:uncharacterized protein (TIGR02147 family)